MTDTHTPSIRDMQALVILKSTRDAAFRKALLANPRATIEKEFNISLPPQVKIDAIDSPAHTLTLVLPHVPDTGTNGEMTDEDLEAVAGGGKSIAGDFFAGLGYDLSSVIGNVIAAGGGNVIAAGGGNVIAAGGGNVIAPGGGNLLGNLNGLG